MIGWTVALTTQQHAKLGPNKSQRRVLMAQQGSLYADNGGWFVRYWEIVRQPDGSLKRKHPAHRLASVKDYPRKSEVIPLKNSFMEKLSTLFSQPAREDSLEAGRSVIGIPGNAISCNMSLAFACEIFDQSMSKTS
jgi:hypothetical protein